MSKQKNMLTEHEQVSAHIQKLEPEIRDVVAFLRSTILEIDNAIGERIKWNNPSFYYNGEMLPFDPKEYKREIAVFNLFKGRIMLVFPSGAKLDNTSGILEGDYKDGRRLVIFKDKKDAESKSGALRNIIKDWLKKVE